MLLAMGWENLEMGKLVGTIQVYLLWLLQFLGGLVWGPHVLEKVLELYIFPVTWPQATSGPSQLLFEKEIMSGALIMQPSCLAYFGHQRHSGSNPISSKGSLSLCHCWYAGGGRECRGIIGARKGEAGGTDVKGGRSQLHRHVPVSDTLFLTYPAPFSTQSV